MLAQLAPEAIDPQTRQILVHPTLQINDGSKSSSDKEVTTSERIFSLGDVAKTGGPRFARAARAQAEIVTSNILSLIRGQKDKLSEYHPAMYEGAIKLTLGKVRVPHKSSTCSRWISVC
jgi:NADH dehydrogenase FAD-containing subunit